MYVASSITTHYSLQQTRSVYNRQLHNLIPVVIVTESNYNRSDNDIHDGGNESELQEPQSKATNEKEPLSIFTK